mmetsp:Transcript_60773/g.142180  ORF Transcript_60773/g.142180 Transcript_60773/m.142180 type:complete len:223 (+) Transcript_60773:943-1611(+)
MSVVRWGWAKGHGRGGHDHWRRLEYWRNHSSSCWHKLCCVLAQGLLGLLCPRRRRRRGGRRRPQLARYEFSSCFVEFLFGSGLALIGLLNRWPSLAAAARLLRILHGVVSFLINTSQQGVDVRPPIRDLLPVYSLKRVLKQRTSLEGAALLLQNVQEQNRLRVKVSGLDGSSLQDLQNARLVLLVSQGALEGVVAFGFALDHAVQGPGPPNVLFGSFEPHAA